MQSPLFRKVQFGTSFVNLFMCINQVPISIHHFPRHFPDSHLAILIFLEPQHHIPVFLLELLNLTTIKIQINRDIFVAHRTDNSIFYKVCIQLGIQKNILNGTWNILIFGTFHDSKLPEGYHFLFTIITKDNITIHLIARHLRSRLNLWAYMFTDTPPFGIYRIASVNKPIPLKRRVHKPEKDSALRLGGYHTISTVFTHHLIYNVGVTIWEVESIETFLLFRDAEFQLIGIVKKEQSTKQRTLPHSLRTDKMHISIQLHLCIRNMGTVQKNNFTQVSHFALPPK